MKYVITIEETVSEDYEVKASSMEEAVEKAKRKYKSCEFVLCPGKLESKRMSGRNTETDEKTDWIEF